VRTDHGKTSRVRIAERALLVVKIGVVKIEAVSAVKIGESVRIGAVLAAIAAASVGKAGVVRAAGVLSRVLRRSMSRS